MKLIQTLAAVIGCALLLAACGMQGEPLSPSSTSPPPSAPSSGSSQAPTHQQDLLAGYLDPAYADGLELIMDSVDAVKTADFRIAFDPTLVRGMSYYTGPIFEISMDEFGGSVGGGGRYDKMIGKFTVQDTPAVGFSIGFERIIMLLLERGYQVPDSREKKAFLVEKNMHQEGMLKVLELARNERQAGKQVMIVNMKKNKKFQKEQLAEQGYTDITECYRDSVENL